MIRVCQVMGNMNGGGVESVVMNYYRHIDRKNIQFDFIVTDNSTHIPRDEIEELGARVYLVPAYKKMSQFKKGCYDLYSQHKEWKIVHSHMNALNVFPLKEAKRAGIPVRISHSHSTSGQGEYVKNAAKAILKSFANKYPTDRFACSKYAGEWLFGKKVPFTIVYNAINLQDFYFSKSKRSKLRSNLNVSDDQIVIGHIGRFMPQKNQAFLVEAFARACRLCDNLVLVFAGSGVDEPKIKNLTISLGIENKVRFLGQREDVSDLYQAFDIFALPSLYEGLGTVAIEAQASGLPCLLSNAVPQEADITNTCNYLPLDDPQVWANALCDISPYCDEKRAHINKDNLSNYDIVRQGEWLTNKYEHLYEEANS